MTIRLLNEDIRTINTTIFRLRSHTGQLNLKLPEDIKEEYYTCIILALDTLFKKLFAYQPSQDNFSYTVRYGLLGFLSSQKMAKPCSEEEVNRFFKQVISSCNLINKFTNNAEVKDLSRYVKKSVLSGIMKEHKLKIQNNTQTLPQKIDKNTMAELSAGKIKLTEQDFLFLWKNALADNTPNCIELKKTLIKGWNFCVLEDKELINFLLDVKNYNNLDTSSLNILVAAIKNIYPLMTKEEHNVIITLTNSVLNPYTNVILEVDSANNKNQVEFADLFNITDKAKLKNTLQEFVDLLVRDEKGLFYISYNIGEIDSDFFVNLDFILDSIVEELQEEAKKIDTRADYDLWSSNTFRMLWLILIVWFRKLYVTLKGE